MKLGRSAPVLIAASVVSGLAVFADAQAPMGTEFTVNTFTADFQGGPEVALAPYGAFVVAWQSEPYCPTYPFPPPPCNPAQDGNQAGVFARRYAPGGVPIGADFQVNVTTAGNQWQPSIARLAGGRFAVVWNDRGGIAGRLLDPAGTPLGAEFVVAGANGSFPAHVAALDNGNFVVVWNEGPSIPLKARRFDAAGSPVAAEFTITSTPAYSGPRAAGGPGGSFVVTWTGHDASSFGILARRFDGTANPVSPAFAVNTYVTGSQANADVAVDAAGNMFVAWHSQSELKVAARRFDPSGVPLGPDFTVSGGTFSSQTAVAAARDGNVLVTWVTPISAPLEVRGRWFDPAGVGGAELGIASSGVAGSPAAALGDARRAVVVWTGVDGSRTGVTARQYAGLQPAALAVDSIGPGSNGVLEAGETAAVDGSWRNVGAGALASFAGAATSLRGFAGPTYMLADAAATYPASAPGTLARCRDTADCYAVRIQNPGPRPAMHWDALLTEVAAGGAHDWAIHVGESFTDVPRTSPFYRFVERVFHRLVMPACAANRFCPTLGVARLEMAQFLLVAKEPALNPPACVAGAEMFLDVPASWNSCRWIEELARRAVVGGCGGGNYCPYGLVSREQLAVFLLRTLEGPVYVPPACGVPRFNDVPASSPFCRWIEELARRGVVAGCGGGAYCPGGLVSRQEMSVFLSVTFGLTLYGP